MLAATLLLLNGCMNFKRLSAILDPDLLYDANKGDDYIKALRGNTKYPDGSTWSSLRAEAAAHPEDTIRAKLYLQSGIALSDQLCSAWFRRLGKAQAEVNADRDVISNVGALTAVIMGAAAAPAVSVGLAAGATGFLEDMFKSEETNFIVAPSVAKVQSAIDATRSAIAADLYERDLAFFEAEAALQRYDNTCSHLSIKRVVDESVTRTADEIKIEERKKQSLGRLAIARGLQDIETFFPQSKPLTASDIFALYALLFRTDLTPDLRSSLTELLKERKVLDTNGNISLTSEEQKALRVYLARMALNMGFDKEIDQLLASRKPVDTSPTPPAPETPTPPSPPGPPPAPETAPETPTPSPPPGPPPPAPGAPTSPSPPGT
jgi:hypothetical protein